MREGGWDVGVEMGEDRWGEEWKVSGGGKEIGRYM